jgi:hypothetical protein
MDFLYNVLAGLIAESIAKLFATSRKWVLFDHRSRAIRKVWSPFLEDNTVVVITGRLGKLARSTIKVSFSEVLAIIKLRSFFEKFGGNFLVYNSIDAKLVAYADSNIILLGSQQSNDVTKQILEKIAVPFRYDTHGNLESHLGKFPTILNGNLIAEDHALIVKCDSPYGQNKKLLILAGNHGTATEAAVKYSISPFGIAEIAEQLGESDFIAIVHVEVESNMPKNYRLVACWKFDEVVQWRKAR